MIKTLIVADDLTGANATGSLLAKHGLRVGTLMGETTKIEPEDFDALAMTTDSRGISATAAKNKISHVMSLFSDIPVGFYNKRIDSTLRGNIGAEIDSILAYLPEQTLALVVAAFPSSGRISSGGYLLVDGVPLEQTGVANDPTSPVTQSKITDIIASQSEHSVGYIPLKTVMAGEPELVVALREQAAANEKIIVLDACTNDDILGIAKAVIESRLAFIAVDPGPFTEALTMETTVQTDTKSKQKTLFVIGSASELTRQQIANFQTELAPFTIKIDVTQFLIPTTKATEIERAVKLVLANLETEDSFLIATNLVETDIIDLVKAAETAQISVHDASAFITASLGEIAYRIMQQTEQQIGGVYLSGGDVTVAFCEKLAAQGIEVKDEILPLAVYGRLIGGEMDGQIIVTKGGLVGDQHALVTCAKYMQTKLSTDYSQAETTEVS